MNRSQKVFDYLISLFGETKVFLVGGAVRDQLLGITSEDLDFAIGLHPTEIKSIISSRDDVKINSAFERFGVFEIVYDGIEATLAAMRLEEDYQDSRHPNALKFVDSVPMDSNRRDFTINAVYQDFKGELIDPQLGVKDINDRVLRMIGNPDKRLEEDPLRILRAIRFKAKYNLKYEEKLYKSMKKNFKLLDKLNPQKIKMEKKKFTDDGIEELDRIKKEIADENY